MRKTATSSALPHAEHAARPRSRSGTRSTSEPSGLCSSQSAETKALMATMAPTERSICRAMITSAWPMRDDADERRRQGDLLEVRAGCRKRGSRSVTAEADDQQREHEAELADAQQPSDEAADLRGAITAAVSCAACHAARDGWRRLPCERGRRRAASPRDRTRRARTPRDDRPPRKTRMRSAMAITSSASSPIRMIAMPCAARCETMRWISALAPTSMPRVG